MSKKKLIELIFFFKLTLGFIACMQETKTLKGETVNTTNKPDTIIVKHKHDLNKSYEIGFYSKSYSYYWLVGNDTLDFVLSASEYEKDSSLHLMAHHKKPILFTTTLTKIIDCYSLIKEDFYLSKLSSFYFKEPIFYFDLAKELSTEYEKQFGRKNISYEKLNHFLLNSNLNKQLGNFLNPIDKTVKHYSIEKFHLLDKSYYREYLPNIDLTKYPEFTITGMGLYVQFGNKQK